VETQAHRVDQVSGARLVGGEMLEWSDLAAPTAPGAAEHLVNRLAGEHGTLGAVLLVGPRAARLAERVPAASTVDLVVRGLPDARRLAVASRLRTGVTVHCGSLDSFQPATPYDVVVLLDGPDEVVSPDGRPLGPGSLLTLVASWLAPEGVLVAGLENELGLERLFRLDASSRRENDAAWGWESPGAANRPLYRHELAGVVAASGLALEETYAALPSCAGASFVVTKGCLDDPGVGEAAAALGARVLADHYTDRPALADPYEQARQLFASGELLALAPGWLIVARPVGAAALAPSLPSLIAVDAARRDDWAVVRTVEPTPQGGTWRVVPVQGRAEMRERSVVRRFDRAVPNEVRGESLESQLRRACHHHDVATVRQLVQRYDAWLREGTERGLDDARLFAVPSNVLVTESGLAALDDSWAMSRPVSDDVLVVHGLRHFAERLLAAGSEHPWAPDTSPDSLTRTLAAMCSFVVPFEAFDEIARLEAEVEVVLHGGGAVDESRGYAQSLQAGRSQFVAQSGPSRGYREAMAAGIRLAEELQTRSAKVEWLEATLATRDRQVDSLERQLQSTWDSASFRMGRLLTWPVRVVVKGLKRIVEAVLPMELVKRAEQVARRFLARG